jgi:Kef-type K+ transport system membrane component KefB
LKQVSQTQAENLKITDKPTTQTGGSGLNQEPIVYSIFMIFSGAALFATAALYLRQSLLVAYILLGILLGPWGLSLVNDAALFKEAAHIGIIFLLFLLGLDLQPQELLGTLRNSTLVTMASSLVFAIIGFTVAWAFGFGIKDAVLVGAAMMFSSTIIAADNSTAPSTRWGDYHQCFVASGHYCHNRVTAT